MNTQYQPAPGQLGNWMAIVGAGLSVVNTLSANRGQKKANEAAERQLQLQIQAKQQSQAADAAAIDALQRIVIVGGGMLVAGGVLITLLKSRLSKNVSSSPKETLKGPG